MRLRNLGVAALAALSLGAVQANGAFGADEVVTGASSWTAKGTTLAQNTPEAIKCSKTAASPNFVLHGTIAGASTKFQATGVECIEAKIENTTVAGVHMAVGSGKLKLTGVSVTEPAGCTTPATIETNSLKLTSQASKVETKQGFTRIEPAVEGGTISTVTLEGCASEGKYPLKGFAYTKSTSQSEQDLVVQETNSDETTAAMSGLTLGKNAVSITAEIAMELAGANKGEAWGGEAK